MNSTVNRIIGFVVGIIQIVLLARLVLKLLGANAGNVFVNFIYSITQPLVVVFEGIFAPIPIPGINAMAIFEPATLIAMVVVALVAWVLQRIFSHH